VDIDGLELRKKVSPSYRLVHRLYPAYIDGSVEYQMSQRGRRKCGCSCECREPILFDVLKLQCVRLAVSFQPRSHEDEIGSATRQVAVERSEQDVARYLPVRVREFIEQSKVVERAKDDSMAGETQGLVFERPDLTFAIDAHA
jgi:hypothetical protein